MKLKINGFDNEIIFKEDSINVLVIKNANVFSHIIDLINSKIKGIESYEMFLLDENDNELNISKEMFMIFDLFNIDYNSKKILSKIYEIISQNVKNKQDYEIENITVKLRKYIVEEINELPFEFVMNDELNVPEVLKLYNLKIDNENYSNIIEKVEILIDILSTLKIARILVIPNLKMYLTEEELVEIYKYSLYNNVNLLLIERESKEKLDYEDIFIIDEEFEETII